MLTRWNDFGFFDRDLSVLDDLRREMDRWFADVERGRGVATDRRPALSSGARTGLPRVGLFDTGTEIRLRAEVPGLTEKDLDVTVEQNSLTIRGERKINPLEGYSVHRMERGSTAFARSFSLPCRVDTEKTTATLKNGILEMTLPKAAEERPRQIQVRAS